MERIRINIERYKKELLIGVTIVVVVAFCSVLYQSYKISKIKQDEGNLPIIKSKIQQIKVKNELSRVIEDNSEYDDSILNGEDSGEIQVINEGSLSLNNKIDEIVTAEELERASGFIGEKEDNKSINRMGFRVQLIALQNEKQAKYFIDIVKKEYASLLRDLDVFYTSVNLEEKGVFYRVQVGFFNTKDKAVAFCESYLDSSKKDLLNCIVLR
ncbi:MAG: SPOR domain-containing protein [Rickettsiales bacterium]|jgi:hypothetical protein|nr:SPOR domain-containing protein [Rickettsiales bacterium]